MAAFCCACLLPLAFLSSKHILWYLASARLFFSVDVGADGVLALSLPVWLLAQKQNRMDHGIAVMGFL